MVSVDLAPQVEWKQPYSDIEVIICAPATTPGIIRCVFLTLQPHFCAAGLRQSLNLLPVAAYKQRSRWGCCRRASQAFKSSVQSGPASNSTAAVQVEVEAAGNEASDREHVESMLSKLQQDKSSQRVVQASPPPPQGATTPSLFVSSHAADRGF